MRLNRHYRADNSDPIIFSPSGIIGTLRHMTDEFELQPIQYTKHDEDLTIQPIEYTKDPNIQSMKYTGYNEDPTIQPIESTV